MWYNIDSTNTMLVCRRKGGQNVTDRQDYRFILQIEPGRYASRGKREHTEPKLILQKYADEHHFFNTRFFIDDGFSGVSF